MYDSFIDDWKTPAEYIDREAAVLALAEQGFDYDKAKQALASVPTADVVAVAHGRWKPTEVPFMNETEGCSVCGYRTVYGSGWHYCPNCGARCDL